MSLNNDGWDEIFAELNIIERVNAHRFCDITATEINRISKRQPRLMAKIDFREHLPTVMKKNDMAVLAISNGQYRVGRFDPFIPIETESKAKIERVDFPSNIITLNPKKLSSESAVLDAALVSGVLCRVFGEEAILTIRGRSRNEPFSFTLNDVLFPVAGVQIEVDGGYEGATTINLIEAKIGAPNNISVRQMIYPQLAWESAANKRKIVRSFVCFYQEPVLRFIPMIYERGLCRADHQNELAFILEAKAKLDLRSIKSNPGAVLPAVDSPFPQADRFDTVLAMFGIVGEQEEMSKEDLMLSFDIVPRQIDYYSNAMRWLGLVTISKASIILTAEGRRLASMNHAERMSQLANIIFSEPIFNFVLNNEHGNVPRSLFERWQVGTESTAERRLQTVQAWVKYFKNYAETRQ